MFFPPCMWMFWRGWISSRKLDFLFLQHKEWKNRSLLECDVIFYLFSLSCISFLIGSKVETFSARNFDRLLSSFHRHFFASQSIAATASSFFLFLPLFIPVAIMFKPHKPKHHLMGFFNRLPSRFFPSLMWAETDAFLVPFLLPYFSLYFPLTSSLFSPPLRSSQNSFSATS